jgi:hypothetical protein
MKIKTNIRAGIASSPRCGGSLRCGGGTRCSGTVDRVYAV